MGVLSDQARKMSPYFRVSPGEEVTVVYNGFKIIPNKFDPEKETIQYKLGLDGSSKFWETGSGKVALFFDTCLEGDIVSIKNAGEDKKPVYELTKIITQDKPKKV